MNAGQATIALERLLLDPQLGKHLAALQQLTPGHVLDQFDAADRNAAAGFEAIGHVLGGTPQGWDLGEAPDWLRLEIVNRIAALITGTADTCLHSPGPSGPQPVFAAACKPNLIVCARCIHLLRMPTGSAADATCDRCGHVCAGLASDDGIYPGVSRYGLLTLMYGCCETCRPTA